MAPPVPQASELAHKDHLSFMEKFQENEIEGEKGLLVIWRCVENPKHMGLDDSYLLTMRSRNHNRTC